MFYLFYMESFYHWSSIDCRRLLRLELMTLHWIWERKSYVKGQLQDLMLYSGSENF